MVPQFHRVAKGIGVNRHLFGCEPLARLFLFQPMHTLGVVQARFGIDKEYMLEVEGLVAFVGHLDGQERLGRTALCEQQQFHRCGVLRQDREVHAVRINRQPQGVGVALCGFKHKRALCGFRSGFCGFECSFRGHCPHLDPICSG